MKKIVGIAFIILSFLLCGCRPETDMTFSSPLHSVSPAVGDETRIVVLINKNSRKYHIDTACSYAVRMAEENRLLIEVPDIDYLREHGYEPCSRCNTEKTDKNQ